MSEVIGWVGNLFIVYGLWGIGNKQRSAFIASMVGEALWIANAAGRSDWALTSICIVFFGMALRSYIKWGEQE